MYMNDIWLYIKCCTIILVLYGPWWENVASFWNSGHETNTLFLTYEGLKMVRYMWVYIVISILCGLSTIDFTCI